MIAMLAVAAVATLLLASACASKANLVSAGGECFLATDCAPGLVCVEQQNKNRVCSDDLTRVAGRTPPEAGAGEAGDAQTDGAIVQPDGTPPADTGTPLVDAATD